MIGSGASSLGWAGGGAIGAKLAAPDRDGRQRQLRACRRPARHRPGRRRCVRRECRRSRGASWALKDALAAVHDGRSAVVAAHLPGVCMMASKLSVFCSTLTSSAGSPRTTSTSAK